MKDVYLNYAQAIFDIAVEEGDVRSYLSCFSKIGKLFKENPEYHLFLSSYEIGKDVQKKSIDEVFKKLSMPQSLIDFLKVLVDHHRMSHFQDVKKNFASLADQALDIPEGIVYSAFRLSESEIESVETAIGRQAGKQVSLHNIVDPSLLGGVKVSLNGRVYDGSLKNRLDGLSEHLLGKGGSTQYEN